MMIVVLVVNKATYNPTRTELRIAQDHTCQCHIALRWVSVFSIEKDFLKI